MHKAETSSAETKEFFRKGCFLTEKLSSDDLKDPGWFDMIQTQARQQDLKQLASRNGLSMAGSKADIANRILDQIKG